MRHKTFPGQYRDERVLLFARESLISYFLTHGSDILAALVFTALVTAGAWALGSNAVGTAVAAGLGVLLIAYFSMLHRQTYLLVTTRRIIKGVRQNVLQSHRREMNLEKIEQIRIDRSTIFDNIFGYGNIHITKGDLESSLFFRGLRRHEEVMDYVSRVLDYRKEHPDTDDITPFICRKERYEAKKKRSS